MFLNQRINHLYRLLDRKNLHFFLALFKLNDVSSQIFFFLLFQLLHYPFLGQLSFFLPLFGSFLGFHHALSVFLVELVSAHVEVLLIAREQSVRISAQFSDLVLLSGNPLLFQKRSVGEFFEHHAQRNQITSSESLVQATEDVGHRRLHVFFLGLRDILHGKLDAAHLLLHDHLEADVAELAFLCFAPQELEGLVRCHGFLGELEYLLFAGEVFQLREVPDIQDPSRQLVEFVSVLAYHHLT